MSGVAGHLNPVPAAPILQRIERFIEEHHYTVDREGNPAGGVTILFERLGLSPKNLERWRNQQFMEFRTADFILCKLGCFLAWHQDPVLAEVYERPLRLTPKEREQFMICDAGHDLHEHGRWERGTVYCNVCGREERLAAMKRYREKRKHSILTDLLDDDTRGKNQGRTRMRNAA